MSSKIKPLKFNEKLNFSSSLENTDSLTLKKEYQLFINGLFQKPLSNKYFASINPANENKIAMVAQANEKDVDLASLEKWDRRYIGCIFRRYAK